MRRSTWRDIAALAFFFLLAAAFVLRGIVTRSIVGQYPSDGTRALYLAREYLLGAVRDGRLPLWNPFIQFGAPFAADMQWAAFYPLNLPFARLPADLAYNLFVGLHLALAGVFMYLLARAWKLGRVAAIVAAMAFMLSGRMVIGAWGGSVNVLSSVAWLPVVLLLFDRAIGQRRPMLWSGLTVLAFGIEVVSGHPQYTFFTVVAVLVLALWRAFERAANGGALLVAARPLVTCVAILAMGAGLSAVQIAPTYEAMTLSTRSFEWKVIWPPSSIEGSYNPLRLATWFVPDLFGNAVSLRPAGTDWLSLALHEIHSNEFSGYIGVLPLLLALFSLTQWRRDARVRFVWTLTAIGVVLALGHHTPIYGLVYAIAPPLRSFRVPARFLTLVVFGLALLAGVGANALLDDSGRRAHVWGKAVAGGAAVLMVGVVAGLLLRGPLLELGRRLAAPLFASRPSGRILSSDGREHLVAAAYALTIYSVFVAGCLLAASAAVFEAARRRVSPTVLAGAIVLVTTVDLGLHAATYTATESMSAFFAGNAPLMDAIRSRGPMERAFTIERGARPDPIRPNDNVFMHEGLYTAGGYESFELATYRPLHDLIDADLRRGALYIASVFGVRFIASDEPLADERLRQIASGESVLLYDNPTALPRAYVAGRARSISDSAAALEVLRHEGLRAGDEVLIESPDAVSSGVAGSAGHATIVMSDQEAIEVHVTADRDGYLVVNDTYYPGWTATIDDQVTPIVRANGHVRALRVGRGAHEVVMRFSSAAMERGKRVSVAVASVTALLIAVAIVSSR